ncbi:ALF repeat-containing protein [Streptomyces stramineus]
MKLSRVSLLVAAAIAPAVLLSTPALAAGAAQAPVAASVSATEGNTSDSDNQVAIVQLVSKYPGTAMKEAAKAALKGTPEDRVRFLETGQFVARDSDNRVAVVQAVSQYPGRGMQEAAKAALNGTPEDRVRFLESGQFVARDQDNRVAIVQLLSKNDSPEFKAAAKKALNGTAEDRVRFLAEHK